MKRQLLPILSAGLLSAGITIAEVQQRTAVTTEQQEIRSQQPAAGVTTDQSATSQFELRQTERVRTRESSAATRDTVPRVVTSPEAATLSENAQVISIRETPEPVRRHIERQAAFVPLQRIVRHTQADQTVYEALFVGAHVQSKLMLSEAGTPLNLHVSSSAPVIYESAGAQRPNARPAPAQMSQQAMNRLQQQIGNAQIRAVQPRTLYEVTVEANGQAQKLWVGEDGSIMP